MKRLSGLLCSVFVPAALSLAVETQTWTQSQQEEFQKGTIERLSLRSDGRLTLAPAFAELFDSSAAYLWALAVDSKGNLYAGGGGPGGTARLHVIPPGGQARILADLDGLEIHAIAVDRQDRIYAATAPDGKVYRVSESGAAEVFYDPATKYIWAMAFDSKGNLYVATGDQGDVHRVAPGGKGGVFFKTEETHARSLAVDTAGNLIVGTEPGGLIVRVSPAGEGFVLHQAPRREITAIALGPDGSIYAAGVGTKQPSAPPPAPIPPAPAPSPTPAAPGPTPPPPSAAAPPQPRPSPLLPVRAVSGGSEIYRIDKESFPRTVWTHTEDIVYALALDGEGRLLAGTGNDGALYRIDSDLVFTRLLTVPATQVTALLNHRGRLYAAGGNVGKVFQAGPELEKEGWIESEVFDAELFSYWGRLRFEARLNGGRAAITTRSGNLDRPLRSWSPWSAPITHDDGERITSPPARFLQWRATLALAPDGTSTELSAVHVHYLLRNVAPVIAAVEITPPNYEFPASSLKMNPSDTITLPALTPKKAAPKPKPPAPSSASQSMKWARGYLGLRWVASDDNGDQLLYDVHIRGVEEKEWKRLREKLEETYFTFDSTAFPDGEYVLRVTASDVPDNPPERALSSQAESPSFLIDNSPPAVSGLAARRASDTVIVEWKGKDERSLITFAEYSVDGGEWTVVEPTTQLSDSLEHDYRLELKALKPGEHTIAVRLTDEFENQALAKTVIQF